MVPVVGRDFRTTQAAGCKGLDVRSTICHESITQSNRKTSNRVTVMGSYNLSPDVGVGEGSRGNTSRGNRTELGHGTIFLNMLYKHGVLTP